MPPYGRRVAAMPKAYRERGTKIFVFAGEWGWPRARAYLEAEPRCARERYVLIAPVDIQDRERQTMRPFQPVSYRWPVAELPVLIVDCGMPEPFLNHLVRALVRDGAAQVESMPYPSPTFTTGRGDWDVAHWVDSQLAGEQAFYYADGFDDVLAQQQRAFDAEQTIAKVAYQIHERPDGQLAEICRGLPAGSLGRLALARATGAEAA